MRPRLRGRFGPAGDGWTSAAPLEHAAPSETEPEPLTTRTLTGNRAPGAEPLAALPAADAAFAPQAPPSARAASEPSTWREQARARQPESDDLQSIRQRLDAIESLKATSTPPGHDREPTIATSSGDRLTSQAATPTPPPVFAHVVIPALRQVTERPADDAKATPRPAVVQSVVERETRIVTRREQRSIDHALRPAGAAPSQAADGRPPQPEAGRGREGEAAPLTAHSRVAPLSEFAYENLPLRSARVQPPPTIRVTIGRIEVRAVQPPPSPAKPRATQPAMSLDDYLRRRGQESVR